MPIPKIIHQIWIGPAQMPSKLMNTFKEKHPDFEYIIWTEEELKHRGFKMECQEAFDRMTEWCGKADILRWEILYQYGGIFQDADAYCLEPFDETFLEKTALAAYENEKTREGLVAVGTMGGVPYYPLYRAAIDWILTHDTCPTTTGLRAWALTGPVLLTNLLNTGIYKDFSVFPSHCFIPYHFTGEKYEGHKKVYCYQEWGSTKQNYHLIHQIEVPREYLKPDRWISVLITSYNTKHCYIKECLESIRIQNGYFGIELVWVDDGSDSLNTELLKLELERFRKSTRFTKVIFKKLDTNQGISVASHEGLLLCTNDLVARMDSDDIMMPNRLCRQIEFMDSYLDCVVCGSDIHLFQDNPQNIKERTLLQRTYHKPKLTWAEFLETRSEWFLNHPTLMFRKSAVLAVGNYNKTTPNCCEDYELELKLLKCYGRVYNITEPLLYYRIHPGQTTYQGKASTPDKVLKRRVIVDNIIRGDWT